MKNKAEEMKRKRELQKAEFERMEKSLQKE